MTVYKCNFCNKEYSTKGILENHQKTAKFCIRLRNNNENLEILNNHITINLKCEYCDDIFMLKQSLERHYEICKIKKEKQQKENEQKKDNEILELKKNVDKLKNELYILMSQTYPERENNLKEEINNYKTENLVLKKELKLKDENHEEQLRMKDEIIFKLEKENNCLRNESKDTIKSFFDKEEKLVDTLLHQNNSNRKNIQNLTINNYNIKPLTSDSVIGAFESYNSKHKNAFNGCVYDLITGDYVSFKVEHVFYGIIKELKDYYGITDISREKIIFNNNGEMTLTTIQEFIKTNIVMNNIDIILEWISNLQSQIQQKKLDGLIDSNGEIRDMTEIEKRDLTDKASTLDYVYKMFNISKERGYPNETMSKMLSEGAMEHGKVVGKIKNRFPSLGEPSYIK